MLEDSKQKVPRHMSGQASTRGTAACSCCKVRSTLPMIMWYERWPIASSSVIPTLAAQLHTPSAKVGHGQIAFSLHRMHPELHMYCMLCTRPSAHPSPGQVRLINIRTKMAAAAAQARPRNVSLLLHATTASTWGESSNEKAVKGGCCLSAG